MDDQTNGTDYLLEKIAHLQAENDSLQQLLQEYQQINRERQQEWQQHETNSIASSSRVENHLIELQSYRENISDLRQQTASAIQRENELERELTANLGTAHQLENIKTQYDHLQAQLNDLSERMLELKNQSSQQSQYSSRIAELESLLSNAEEEIMLLKEQQNN